MWTKYLHDFCEKNIYPKEAEDALVDAAQAVMSNDCMRTAFEQHLFEYQMSHELSTIEAALEHICELTQDFFVVHETVEFLYFVLCSEQLKKLYIESSYPDSYFHGIMLDMRCKIKECYSVRHVWGCANASWFCAFFALCRFAIGRLQYEMKPMPACMSVDGKYCYNGETSVNVHIPSLGPLKCEEVQESFEQATDFFADYFQGEYVLFVCHSWLLFPMHFQMLPKESGIRKFMDEFTIVSVTIDSSRSGHMWRIFGTYDMSNPSTLPRKTTLQRIYADWMEAGKPVGEGIGVKYVKKHMDR